MAIDMAGKLHIAQHLVADAISRRGIGAEVRSPGDSSTTSASDMMTICMAVGTPIRSTDFRMTPSMRMCFISSALGARACPLCRR